MDDAERNKQFLPYGFQKHSCKLLRIIELQYLLLITANTVIKLTPAERDEKQLLHSTITLLTTNYCYYHYYITIYYRYYHYYCYYYYYYCCCYYHYYYYSITYNYYYY